MGVVAIIGGVAAAGGLYEDSQANSAANAAQAQQRLELQKQDDLAEQQNQRSNALFQRYMSLYGPAQQELVSEAEKPIDANVVAGQAGADVQQAEAAQNVENQQREARYGINPYSGAAQALQNQADIQDTATQAGAMTGARRYAQTETLARLGAVANSGNALLSAAQSSANGAASGYNSAATGFGLIGQQQANLAGAYGQAAGYGLSQLGNYFIGNIPSSALPSLGTVTPFTPAAMPTVDVPGGG